jgi:hypothetical protein
MPYGDGPRSEHALAKVEAQDLLRLGYGGEGSLLIPTQQKIDVRPNLVAKRPRSSDSVWLEYRYDLVICELL